MTAETEFNSIQFEKKLSGLKDSQDSINVCCLWCLENRLHHKKIVSTWLNVLKRVRVEQRLTLFYLANDVIQYSKRKNYEFVESWGTALQKATTMVRDEKVKHKILRIFKIWEQRAVYGEEFIMDLCGLISASPSSKKIDETHEFQSTYLINKIRNCAKLETDTDHKLRLFKQHNPKLLDGEALVSSLKDRAHVDDVEKEMEDYVSHMEEYVNALKMEIKARNNLINLLLNAETQLEKDRKDVKVVAVAYKSFATRVKNLKKKLEDKKSTLMSPIPSPDINAPSPSPDSELDLPDTDSKGVSVSDQDEQFSFTNAGFYNPVSSAVTETTNSFVNNGFSSFMGSGMPFNMQNLNASNIFNSSTASNVPPITNVTQTTESNYSPSNIASLFPSIAQPPPPPEPVPPVTSANFYNPQLPLAPPPLPPFTKSDSVYGADVSYNDYNNDQSSYDGNYNSQQTAPIDPYQSMGTNYTTNLPSYENNSTPYTPTVTSYESVVPSHRADTSYPYDPYNPDEYNPEEEPETWDVEEQWDQPPQELDTPASPPPLEKESFLDPIEYHDGQDLAGGTDVDHRVLNVISNKTISDKKKDVDHRNLISLTGSPKLSSNTSNSWSPQEDQDYRVNKQDSGVKDHDYRSSFNVDGLTLPPPPPPPSSQLKPKLISAQIQSPRKLQDNTESIDMELSDDEEAIVEDMAGESSPLEENGGILPPPPFPDDEDANLFLDSLNESFDNYEIYENLDTNDENTAWNNNVDVPLEEPPVVQVGLLGDRPSQPFMGELGGWMEPPIPFQQDMRFRGRGRGNRGHFVGNRGEFNNRGEFRGRGRGFRGNNKFWTPQWGEQRGKPRGRGGRGRPRGGFVPRGNFRGNFMNFQ